MHQLTQEEVSESVLYDPCSGKFYREICGDLVEFGYVCSNGYVYIRIDGKIYSAHRMAWLYHYGYTPRMEIDHIDHDRENNRIDNLRVVTRQENQRNRSLSSNNKSGVIGVHFDENSEKWRASITLNNKTKHLGSFEIFKDAVESRKQAEIKYKFHQNHGKKS